MRVIVISGCGLRPIAGRQEPHRGIKGSELMHKVMFAAALAVGMITAPMPGFVSTAAAQQQAPASDKTAKSKKEPSTGQLAARERQKKCAVEWKEARPPAKSKKERRGRNSGAHATNVSSPHRTNASQNFSTAHEQPTSKNSALKKLRASARPEVSPTPSCVIRNRGAAARSHCADHSMTRTGPYDSISDT